MTAPVWALDVDGTLLEPDGSLHADSVSGLRAAVDAGVHVVLATGRVPAAVAAVRAAVGRPVWAITCGGQLTLPPGWPAAAAAPPLATLPDGALAGVLAAVADRPQVAVQVYEPSVDGTSQRVWRPNAAHEHLARTEGLSFGAWAPGDAVGALLKVVLTAEPEVFTGLPDALEGHPWLATGCRYRDLLPAGVDKGRALRALCAARGWTGRVLAAGDAENDLALFGAADVRVAVAGRCAALEAAADEVLATQANAAVVRAAWRLLPPAGAMPQRGGASDGGERAQPVSRRPCRAWT